MKETEYKDLEKIKDVKEYCNYLFKAKSIKKHLKRVGINSSEKLVGYIEDPNQFLKIPPTNSSFYENDLENLITTDFSNISTVLSSSGTTGKKKLIPISEIDLTFFKESSVKCESRLNTNSEHHSGLIANMGMGLMWYAMMTQKFEMKAKPYFFGILNPLEYIELIKTLPVNALISLPIFFSRFYEFCTNINKNEILKKKIKRIDCGGDFLSDGRKNRIERNWEANTNRFYGISEVWGPISGECKYHKGLHISSNHILFEILHPLTLRPVNEGEIGILHLTALWDKAVPLFRYDTQDLVKLLSDTCPCNEKTKRFKFVSKKDSIIYHNDEYSKFFSLIDIEDIIFNNNNTTTEYRIILKEDELIIHLENLIQNNSQNSEIEEKILQKLEPFNKKCQIISHKPRTISRKTQKVKIDSIVREPLK